MKLWPEKTGQPAQVRQGGGHGQPNLVEWGLCTSQFDPTLSRRSNLHLFGSFLCGDQSIQILSNLHGQSYRHVPPQEKKLKCHHKFIPLPTPPTDPCETIRKINPFYVLVNPVPVKPKTPKKVRFKRLSETWLHFGEFRIIHFSRKFPLSPRVFRVFSKK